jgi:hypothetical protein
MPRERCCSLRFSFITPGTWSWAPTRSRFLFPLEGFAWKVSMIVVALPHLCLALFPHSIIRDVIEEGGDVNLLGITSGVRLVSTTSMLTCLRRCRRSTSFVPRSAAGHTTLGSFEDVSLCRCACGCRTASRDGVGPAEHARGTD